MRPRIVHVITGLGLGGAEALLMRMITHPQASDFEHAVVFFHDGPFCAQLKQAGIMCVQVQGVLCAYDPLFLYRLYRAIHQLKPQLLHTWLWSANILGRIIGWMLSVPVLSSFHNNVDQDGGLRNFLDQITRSFAQRLVAVSEGVASSLQLTGNLAQKLIVIRNGIDAQAIAQAANSCKKTRAEFGFAAEHYIIGSVGRLVALKNYQLFLETMALLVPQFPQVRFVIVGSGPEKENLTRTMHKLALDHYGIIVPASSALGWYPLFDLFVQSSYKEGISMALLEALSCGKACVVTNDQKTHAVLEDRVTGRVVSSYTAADLAEALQELITQQMLRAQLAEAGAKMVREKFNFSTMLQNYTQEYGCLMRPPKGMIETMPYQ